MKRNLLKPLILLFALLVGGLNAVWGQEVLYYTLDGTQTESGGNNGYAQAGDDVVQNDMNWSVMANCSESPWRIGGKGITNEDRPVYSKTAMDAPITKVELEIGDITIASVNSITMIVASDANFANPLETKAVTTVSANSTLTFTPNTPATSWATGAYYKFVFNVTQSGKSNKFIQLKSIKFYKAGTKTDPTITFNNGSVNVYKTLDLSSLFTSDSDGAVTYSITAGDGYATIDGSVLTGTAEGTVTIKAEQAATGSYNAGEATATITVNPALILSSIAITTEPTKTTYSEGETFDPTGMVVTATYNDNSTEDVTSSCTFSPATELTTSDTEITVSYTENGVTKTATQAITVNEYVQPTTVTIQMTNSLFGEEVHTSGKSTEEMTFVGTKDNVTVTYSVPNDSYYYFNTSNTRPYDTCSLTYAAPNGYVITKIVFTSDGQNWNTATPSVGSMTGTKTWEGSASSVTFSWKESGTRIKTVVVTLAKIATITLASACTDGTDFFGTYSNESAFVVPSDLTVSAVSVAEGKLVVTDYETGDIVKANTGVMVSSATAGEHTVLLSSETGTEIDGNMLKSSGAGITATEMTTAAPSCQYYRLTMHNGETIGYWWGAENGAAFAVVANKAYLAVPESAGAPALGFEFGDETTGIQNIERTVNDNQYYTLDGRRVAQPTKGLYIVNGKKVIIK